MPLITLADGTHSRMFDLGTREIVPGKLLARHCLRLHIYDPWTNLATEQFVTRDRELQSALMSAVRKVSGHIDQRNGWIKPRVSRREFIDASAERRMVLKDLQQYFGDDATIRSTARRKIYYLSDGNMASTPDNIGMRFNMPLIYEGEAIATIFDIGGLDPLSPDGNVVYWLTKPMWESFHSRRRKIPKEFPWPTGFLASKWCQRDGFDSYGDGRIHLASMTQGQTVGSWAMSSLRLFWLARQNGKDIFSRYGKQFKPEELGSPSAGAFEYLYNAARSTLGYSSIGMHCFSCGGLLPKPYGVCHSCNWECSTYEARGFRFCANCGHALSHACSCKNQDCKFNTPGTCECENTKEVKLPQEEHNKQYTMLYGEYITEAHYNVIKL